MVARLYGQGRAEAVASSARILEQMDLVEAADRRVQTYSGGMRRRLDLGASLVGSPRLLLLDEPTTGLDPGSRNEVWDAHPRDEPERAPTSLLTTQYLDEADHLAAYIVIIDGGRVIAQGTPDELKSRVGRRHGRAAHRRRAHHAAGGRGARVARDRRAVHRPGDAPVLPRRTGRLPSPARRRARAGRRRGAGGGHHAAPSHARRGVPRPHRAHHRLHDHDHPDTDPTIPRRMQHDHGHHTRSTAPGSRPSGRPRTGARRIWSPRARWRPARSRSSCARRRCSSRARRRGCSSFSSSATSSAARWATPAALTYVDFLVPGFVVTGVLFQGMGAASGVADDLEGGLFDRLREPADPPAARSSRAGWAPTRRWSPGA